MDRALVTREEGDNASSGKSKEKDCYGADEGAPEAPVDAVAGAEIALNGLVEEGLCVVLDDGQDGLSGPVGVHQ